MEVPPPDRLMAAIRALPAARALLERLDGTPGVYLVGGVVRDVLLGRPVRDLDVAVDGDVPAVAARLGASTRVHDRFGTCTVQLDGFVYDFARSRRERYRMPGALPEVEPAPIEEDLLRRDFTVNAMAMALAGPGAGRVLHAPRALEDLEAGALRVLHDESFRDDPTRLLRLARYASRLAFEPEPHTAALAREAVRRGALATPSGDRVGTELRLLAAEPDPLSALAWLAQLGIDRGIAPGFGMEEERVGRAALALLPDGERRDLLALALAARGLESSVLGALLDRLAFTAGDRDAIVAAVVGSGALADRLARADGPAAIAAAVGAARPEAVALAGALGPHRAAADWLERLRHVRLEIRGDDLLAAGIQAGPAIGQGLRAALAAKLDGLAPDRGAELAVAVAAAVAAAREAAAQP